MRAGAGWGIRTESEARSDLGSMPAETVVRFVGGGLFGLLTWWLDARIRPSVEEVNALFRRLAIPAVRAALGRAALSHGTGDT